MLDFCLDEIGKIDWVQYFVSLRELTIANNSVTEIEVRLPFLLVSFRVLTSAFT